MLKFKSLGSGSAGNATVVEASNGIATVRLLVDCGMGVRQLERRLAQADLAASDIDAIFVTHEHADHIGCVQAYALRHRIPVWMSQGTHRAMGSPDFDGLLRRARDAHPIDLGDMQVMPFTVPHDAREPLQLTCFDGAVRLGIVTDLGHATPHVLDQIGHCHALMLESNHDPDMLAVSSYPAFLKHRVGGLYGHLANPVAAAILAQVRHAGLRRVVAAHLSAQNNHPDIARRVLAGALDWDCEQIDVASAAHGTPWFEVG